MHGAFILLHGAFMLLHGAFMLPHGAFMLLHGAFVLLHGAFMLQPATRALCALQTPYPQPHQELACCREGLDQAACTAPHPGWLACVLSFELPPTGWVPCAQAAATPGDRAVASPRLALTVQVVRVCEALQELQFNDEAPRVITTNVCFSPSPVIIVGGTNAAAHQRQAAALTQVLGAPVDASLPGTSLLRLHALH